MECKLSNFISTLIPGRWNKESQMPNVKGKEEEEVEKERSREEKKYAVKGRLGIAQSGGEEEKEREREQPNLGFLEGTACKWN